MIGVQILVLPGAMPTSVTLTSDVLATANALAQTKRPPFQVSMIGAASTAWSAILGIPLDCGAAPAVVIMPGLGLARPEAIAPRLAEADAREAMSVLCAARAGGAEIATSCSGAFLFAEAGLLDGRRATTSWWLAPLFRQWRPAVDLTLDALIVRDDGVVTAGASMAQMDLMLDMVARHAGAALADRCARYLLLDERRSQSRYMALSFLVAADPQLAKAESWAKARLGTPIAVDQLAAAAGLAPRTFARRMARLTGLSPVRFLQRLRVEAAKELIETTRFSIDEIAHRVGYLDTSALRRLMGRDLGLRPSQVRQRPSQASAPHPA